MSFTVTRPASGQEGGQTDAEDPTCAKVKAPPTPPLLLAQAMLTLLPLTSPRLISHAAQLTVLGSLAPGSPFGGLYAVDLLVSGTPRSSPGPQTTASSLMSSPSRASTCWTFTGMKHVQVDDYFSADWSGDQFCF